MAPRRNLRQFRLDAPVARFLKSLGYEKVTGARRYISPTGQEISRRQAEQQSGALQAIFGVGTREELTRAAPTYPAGKRRTIRQYAEDWRSAHNDTRGINRVLKDPNFRNDLAYFRDRSIPWSTRRRHAARVFGWQWIEQEHYWRY